MKKLKKNIDFKILENYGFIKGSTYYFMYNNLNEGVPKQLQIHKGTGAIIYTNGTFEKGEKIIKKLEEAEMIEHYW